MTMPALQPPEARLPPICRHFGACGGCSMQSWPEPAILDWKRETLIAALAGAGFPDPPLAKPTAVPMGQRRRADFALARADGRAVIGLHEARGKSVIDLAECPQVLPEIAALLPSLRALAASLSGFRRQGSAIVNRLDHGLDLSLVLDGTVTAEDRARLAAFARAHTLLRLSLAEEPVIQMRPPVITFDGVAVTAPPAAFLQPSAAGEAAIKAAVLAALPGNLPRKSRIIELYAGIGTLSFALAARAKLLVVEGNLPAAAALAEAANRNGLAGRITVEPRDLARRPLLPQALKDAAAVVLDPPFDGAGPQMPNLAAAAPKRIIYVSCNPMALARDAQTLRRAGYRLDGLTAIDQFPATTHIEAVAAFTRP